MTGAGDATGLIARVHAASARGDMARAYMERMARTCASRLFILRAQAVNSKRGRNKDTELGKKPAAFAIWRHSSPE